MTLPTYFAALAIKIVILKNRTMLECCLARSLKCWLAVNWNTVVRVIVTFYEGVTAWLFICFIQFLSYSRILCLYIDKNVTLMTLDTTLQCYTDITYPRPLNLI